jgi:imidazolonepropionase-like amidohydrolase
MTIPFAFAPRRALAGLAIAALAAVAPAQNTPARPRPQALVGVRLAARDGAPTVTIILRDGRIESLLDVGAPLPPDAWVVEAEGLIATPGFIDAWTGSGLTVPTPQINQDRPVDTGADVRIDMRLANRKGVMPAFNAAEAIALSAEDAKHHRKAGFGLALVAPGGQLLAGRGALITLRDAAPRDLVLGGSGLQYASFKGGRGGYPGTLMAYHAQLRQFFLDAEHNRVLRERWQTGRSGPRPAWDAELEAGAELLAGGGLACEAYTARDVNRWLRLADELGLRVEVIVGGTDAWKVADELARRGIAVVLDLDWGDEPKAPGEEDEAEGEGDADEEEEAAPEAEPKPESIDYDYHEPLGVRAEKRRLWEQRRDNALRLHEAGVAVLFGSGDGKPADLLEHLRDLVEQGLPREVALAALTDQAADLLGMGGHYGGLREGASATLCLWTADPFTEDAQVVWSFVDGFGQEFEVKSKQADGEDGAPAKGVDLTGTWKVVNEGNEEQPMTLILTMDDDGAVEGSCAAFNPMDGSALSASVSGRVEGTEVHLAMTFSVEEFEVKVKLDGTLDGDSWSGTTTLELPGNEQENDFEATRQPGGSL